MGSRKLPGHLQQRGPISWRWTVGVEGVVHAETIRAASRKEAAAIAAKKFRSLEPDLERRGRQRRLQSITVSQLVERFVADGLTVTKTWTERREVTREKYASSLLPLKRYYVERGDPPAADLDNLDDFLKWRAKDVVPGTLAQERTVASAMFDWAMREKLMSHNPARASRAPKVDRRTPVILTEAELDRLLAECERDPMLWMYVLVQAEAGLRCESEVLWLRWEDVTRVAGFLVVACFDGHQTKGGKPRDVPLTPRLDAALKAHVARFRDDGTDSPWVFHDEMGQRIGRLDDAFRRARNKARKPRHPGDVVLPREFERQHDLRARRITTWLDEGQNVMHVKEWVGHEHLDTTQIYYRYARKSLQAPRLALATQDTR